MAVNIHESAEDYLESIYILLQKNGTVRSIDVVNDLGVSKPSVSVAMKKLRENGYIAMAADGHITLLPRGEAIARSVYERHELLTRLFVELGVPEDIAAADYRSFSNIPCLYVETGERDGYVQRYWVSVESGLLVGAEKLQNGETVYRAAERPEESPAVTTADFTLPDGTVLHTVE